MRVLFLLGLMVCATQASNSILIKLLAKFRIGNCQGDCPCDNSTNGLKAAEAKLTELQNAVNGLSRSLNQATAANSSVENAQSAVDELKSSLTSTTPSSMPRRRFRRGANSVNFTSCEVSNQTLVGSVENVTLIVLDGIITALQTISTSFQVTKLNCYTNITQKLAYGLHDGTYNVPSNAQNLLSKADNASAKATQAKTNINNAITNFKENLAKKKTELESQKGVVLNLGGTVPDTSSASTVPTTAEPNETVCSNSSNPTTISPTAPTSSSPSITTASSCNITRAYCPDCGVANINVVGLRIVNGSLASVNEYPYQVAVFASGYICGGSIIKKKWILTAAHCFFDEAGNQPDQNAIEVRYGNINLPAATAVMAKGYITHENYDNNTYANDIALVELATELTYTPAVQPICLAEDSDIPYGGKAVASGWGATAFKGNSTEDLMEVALDVITMTACEASGISLPKDTTKVMCALTNYKDTCQGDSGGPLVARVCPNRWVQIGIVSYGDECARPNNPGIYTKVPAYRTWIDGKTGSSTAC